MALSNQIAKKNGRDFNIVSSFNGLNEFNVFKCNTAFHPTEFTFKIDTSLGDGLPSMLLPVRPGVGGYNFVVLWDDGQRDVITNSSAPEADHTYATGGQYEIGTWGDFQTIGFNYSGGDGDKLIDVLKFGSNFNQTDSGSGVGFPDCDSFNLISASDIPPASVFLNMGSYFNGCALFNVDIGSWDTSNVTNMAQAFRNCPFNQDISSWDTSSVTTIFSCFSGNTVFNQPIGSWNTSSINTFSYAFNLATAFNQTLGGWDTSSGTEFRFMFWRASSFNDGNPTGVSSGGVGIGMDNWDMTSATNMQRMFYQSSGFNSYIGSWRFPTTGSVSMSEMFGNATSFNQDISAWNVERVTTFQDAFTSSSFNQNISSWDVSNCTNFRGMFRGTPFNQAIGTWTMTQATDLSLMFQSSAFNQDLGSWDVSGCTNMSSMFASAPSYNNGGVNGLGLGIDNWNVSSVTDFNSMFYQSSGSPRTNLYINSWNTSSATNMTNMFRQNNAFNQPLNNWDTASVTSMNNMFYQSSSFNQDISSWSIASLTNAGAMLDSSGFSTINYDLLLDSTTGWASQATIQNNVGTSFGTTQYTAGGNAEAGRNILTGTYGWTITDGGPV